MNLSTQKNLYRSLLLGAAASALASGAAFAADDVETVVVTGSLIQHSAGDEPIPTIVIDADTIAKTGQANIGRVLAQLPQISNTNGDDLTATNSNFLTSGFGVSNVDLRGLGANRTLVLVNGRRWVTGSPKDTGVDLNTIPTQLIDHVDTITGGASATYGSDAIAGVVNITLKQDFEGINATAQYGGTSRGDGGDAYGSVLIGGNFLNGKGNIAVVMSYEDSQKIQSGDRDITSIDTFWGPGGFENVGGYSSYAPKGKFGYAVPNSLGQLVEAGKFYTSDDNSGSDPYRVFSTASDGFNRNPNRYIQVPVIRRLISETGHVDIFPWAKFIFEGTYAHTSASSNLEPYPGSSDDGLSKPIGAGGTGILIPLTNPFLPADFTNGTGTPSTAIDPNTGETYLSEAQGVYFYRRFSDLGSRFSHVDRDMARIALGFEGDFGTKEGPLSDWKWNLTYVYGRTAESQYSLGYYDKIKMQSALDARLPTGTEVAPAGGGGYVCDDPVAQAAGCVPINLFGAGSITPEAAAYVSALATLQDRAIQQVATFNMNGSVFQLPAGAVKAAVGAEYRNERADFLPDAASQAGTIAGNQSPATSGAFDVKEVYGEGLLPVLKDLPFAEYVELNGAIRYAHYSTVGSATTWKYGATWQVNDQLKFRGMESSATRAPNIGELFTPNSQTFPGITKDLCEGVDIVTPTTNLEQNCKTQINSVGGASTPSYAGDPGQAAKQGVGGYQSGNPNLKPETAHTFTAGIVYTPSWLQGLQFTSDYYDIRIHGYISALDPQQTQQACYEGNPSEFATNIFCQQIIRQVDSNLGPIIKQINFPYFNLGSIKTAGVDTTISYSFDLADIDRSLENAGSLAMSLNTTYISHWDQDPGVPGTSVLKIGGDAGVEKWSGLFRTTYANGPLEVTTTLHYIGKAFVSKESALAPPANTTELEGNIIPSYWYVDLNVSYDVTDSVQAYVGANNLFDTRPPETYPGTPFENTGTGTIANVYDPIGLFVYGGVNLKM
ncbi:MAG TPA: TonB-dependent receptor [Rhizomicrobium sp.]|nr:TonB-dependent receptor [Rhizomicrobium sp.]